MYGVAMISDLTLAALNCHGYKDGLNDGDGVLDIDGVTVKVCGITYIKPIHEVEVVMYELEDCTVLVVRGTELKVDTKTWFKNWLDLVRDLRFYPWKTPWGWAHRGFYRGAHRWYNTCKDQIPTNKPIVLSGHSMGAQIAVWIAMMCVWKLARVVVFAEPKGFYQSSKEMYRSKGLDVITRSFLTNRDWIEDIPFWGKRSVVPIYAGEGSHAITDYLAALKKKELEK